MINVLSLSGGKDSVGAGLYLKRKGVRFRCAYVDTIWEWAGHEDHLRVVEQHLGPIDRIAPEQGFEETVRRKGTFPSRVRKWCTEELKLKPFRDWLDRLRAETGDEVQVIVGVRQEESAERSQITKMREHSDFYDCDIIRPILHWSVGRVIGEHRRAGCPMHPLYHEGAERVGCFPCVNASKEELAIVARLAPERIDVIRKLEAEIGQTMFTRDRRTEKKRLQAQGLDGGPSVVPIGIDEVIAWAKTDRGSDQLVLFRPPSGCARWGVCERPARSEVA